MSDIATSQNQGSLIEPNGTVMEMAAKLAEMKQKLALVNQFFKEVMVKDVDYGIVPGTDKPALYQPGADKLNSLYNYGKVIAGKDESKDFATGHYFATVKVQLVHRGSGTLISEGEGSCSTMESKYRYRWGYERDIPKGVNPADLLSKEYENKTTGAKWLKYRIENDDLFSLWNTVLKMATKRAYVAATLAGTGLSALFSQEEDELDAWIEGEATEAAGASQAPKSAADKPKSNAVLNTKDLSITVNFGKHKGKTLGEILDADPSYLSWLVEKAQAEKVRTACANILNALNNPSANMADQTPPPPPEDNAQDPDPGAGQQPEDPTDLDGLFGGE